MRRALPLLPVLYLLTCLLPAGLALADDATGASNKPAKAIDAGKARLSELATALRGNRRSGEAQTAYGRALIEAGELKRAERTLKAAARIAKDSPESLYELARVRFASDDYRRSRAACAELERTHPEHVLGAVCMARAFLVWRRGSRADEHLQVAIARDPARPEVLLATADVRRVEGRRAEAKAAYDAYLGLRPDAVAAHIGLGRLHLSSGEPALAVEAFRRAVEVAPHCTEALFALGAHAEGPEAVQALRRLLHMQKNYPEASVTLGRALLSVGDDAEAETRFVRALKRNKKDARAHIGLGMARLRQGRFEEAEKSLSEGLALRPDFAEANLALAEIYEKTERFEEAFLQYRSAASKRPTDVGPLLTAGKLALSLGRSVLSAAFLQKGLERAPKDAHCHGLLGDLLARRGDAAAARAHYEQAIAGKGEVDRAALRQKLAALK